GAPLADQVTRKCLLASNSLRAIGLRSKRFQSNTAADASISPVAQRNQIAGKRRGGRIALREGPTLAAGKRRRGGGARRRGPRQGGRFSSQRRRVRPPRAAGAW